MTIPSHKSRYGHSIVAIPSGRAAGEVWLPMPNHEGLYEVSSEGRVRSLYFDPPRILRPSADKDGYPVIMLSKGGRRRPFALHRMVALAFHGPGNVLHNEVAHLDGNHTNARADNLKWVSKVENHFHMRAHGTHRAGEQHPRAKLTAAEAAEIRRTPGPHAALAKRYGVCVATVSDIKRGRRWRDSHA